MKILTYISSLILSGFVYFLFAAYMTASASLDSVLPLISFYSALTIFGFLSWFHFFKPKLGAILLTILTVMMFFTWPIFLLIDYFDGDYTPAIIEYAIPLLFSFLTIFSVWWSQKEMDINRYVKLLLAIPPLLLTLYFGGYFTLRIFG
ncbi:MAG TPA: hypothetical protein DDZ56_09145 [Cytophagales bacterium]|nr:hypothetical protein [Cytophagales bacterium]